MQPPRTPYTKQFVETHTTSMRVRFVERPCCKVTPCLVQIRPKIFKGRSAETPRRAPGAKRPSRKKRQP